MCDICHTISRKQLASDGLNKFEGTRQPSWHCFNTVAVGGDPLHNSTNYICFLFPLFGHSLRVPMQSCLLRLNVINKWHQISDFPQPPLPPPPQTAVFQATQVPRGLQNVLLSYLKRIGGDKMPCVNDDCYCFFLLLGLWQTFGSLYRTVQLDTKILTTSSVHPGNFLNHELSVSCRLGMRQGFTLDRTPVHHRAGDIIFSLKLISDVFPRH